MARRRVACSGIMALVEGRTRDGVRAHTDAALAGVRLGARVAIVAGCSVGRVRIRAEPGARIADPSDMTGVEWAAYNRIATHTGAVLAGVAAGARIPIVAGGSVRRAGCAAHSRYARRRGAGRRPRADNAATSTIGRISFCRNAGATAETRSGRATTTSVAADLTRRASDPAPTTVQDI